MTKLSSAEAEVLNRVKSALAGGKNPDHPLLAKDFDKLFRRLSEEMSLPPPTPQIAPPANPPSGGMAYQISVQTNRPSPDVQYIIQVVSGTDMTNTIYTSAPTDVNGTLVPPLTIPATDQFGNSIFVTGQPYYIIVYAYDPVTGTAAGQIAMISVTAASP